MALETLTVQPLTRDGALIALQSVTIAGGFQFPNNGKTLLYLKNDALDELLTFKIQTSIDGQSGLTRAIDVTASESWVMGPFPVDIYNDADGNVFCTPETDITSLIALVSL